MSNRRGLKTPVLVKQGRAVPGSVAAKEQEQAAEPTLGRKRVVVRPIIIKYLTENLGVPVHINEMVEMTGADKSSVQAAMLVLLNEDKLNIDVIVGGNTWVYRGVKSAVAESAPVKPVGSKQLYTELGTAKDGAKILEDEEGNLWRATEL